MNRDTKKATLILAGWAVLCLVGLVGISDPRYGMTLVGFATAGLALIVYSSWLIERTEKRLRKYIDKANENIRK